MNPLSDTSVIIMFPLFLCKNTVFTLLIFIISVHLLLSQSSFFYLHLFLRFLFNILHFTVFFAYSFFFLISRISSAVHFFLYLYFLFLNFDDIRTSLKVSQFEILVVSLLLDLLLTVCIISFKNLIVLKVVALVFSRCFRFL